MKARKTWSSKIAYILAVAGATVGFSAILHRGREADHHTLYHLCIVFILATIFGVSKARGAKRDCRQI